MLFYYMRTITLVLIDIIFINLSVYIALLLRFDGLVPPQHLAQYITLIPLITLVSLFFLVIFQLYNRVWEYASLDEMFAIVRATTFSLVIIVSITYLFGLTKLPRSVYIIAWAAMNIFIGSSRISWRFMRDYWRVKEKPTKRVLIIGGGDAGAMLIREIHNNSHLGIRVMGLIDDNPLKKGKILLDHKVLGNRDSIPKIVENKRIDEIIIAMPSVTGAELKEIVKICNQTTAKIKILPNLSLIHI